MFIQHPSPPTGAIPFALSCLLSSLVVPCVEAQAQEAVVRMEENLRAEPNGVILGQLKPGARVSVEGRDGGWTQVAIRGFIFVPSLQVWTDGPLDLVVSAPDGENLRDEPSGRITGRLGEGTLLEEIERLPGWIEVRRVAWIWSASLEGVATSAAAEVADPEPSAQPADRLAITEAWLRGGATGAPILATPDGDTLARAEPGSDLRVLAREGNWARIQIEGWVWVPGLVDGAAANGPAGEPAVLSGVAAADLSTDPESYEGRLVELDLQFISVERAERLRTDFYEGEPFLLTRSAEGDRVFVYVAVPPERLPQVESISPLQEIRVVGRVRSAAAALTGNPILDLVEIETRR